MGSGKIKMKISKKIKIEGDFIDSFIYSGSLFLVDTQLNLTSYSWNQLISISNCPSELSPTLKDCFSKMETKNISNLNDTYFIYNDILHQHTLGHLALESWPTDLDIYKNNFIISSAEGIKTIKGDRTQEGEKVSFKFGKNLKKMWDEKVFELAVGNLDRLIISCGYEGAFELFTQTKSDSYKLIDEKRISEKEWIGCEWDTDTGIAILKNNLKQKILQFEKFDNQYYSKLTDSIEKKKYREIIKNEDPIDWEIPSSNQNYINSWILNEKLYFFDENLKLYECEENNLIPISQVDNQTDSIGTIIDSAKTNFGVVFEDINKLYLHDSGVSVLSEHSTNWRTYPKSKNYQNHIHIIEDDYLTVQIFNI